MTQELLVAIAKNMANVAMWNIQVIQSVVEKPHFSSFFITTLKIKPSQAAPTLELQQQMWMQKPNEVTNRCHNCTDTNLSSDKCHAKNLRTPISVNEIVSMPINSFNTMLASEEKNKVAAQNCCKRKLNAILHLESSNAKGEPSKEHSQCSKSSG